jgi:galactose mutarotase-like enzyme
MFNKPELSLYSNETGIKMDVTTSYPSVVLFTFRYPEKYTVDEYISNKHSGIAIECQKPPIGNSELHFKENVLNKDKEYHESIKYTFSIL